MKPSTDIEVTTAVLHRVRQADHDWSPACCSSEPFDRLEAEELVSAFGEFGWHLSADVALSEVAPSRNVETSRAAAESIDNVNDRQWAVWWLLSYRGAQTDEELADGYSGTMVWDRKRERHFLPKQTPQSIRTRRHELVLAGHVYDTGERRPTKTGRQAIVWAAREAGQVAA